MAKEYTEEQLKELRQTETETELGKEIHKTILAHRAKYPHIKKVSVVSNFKIVSAGSTCGTSCFIDRDNPLIKDDARANH